MFLDVVRHKLVLNVKIVGCQPCDVDVFDIANKNDTWIFSYIYFPTNVQNQIYQNHNSLASKKKKITTHIIYISITL